MKNADSNIDTKKWIEIFPIIRENRDIKVNGKFEYNVLLEIVKAYEGATFEGCVKGSPSNYENLSYSLKKYKDKGFLKGYINEITGKYEIQVIKNLKLKPSPLACFIRAGTSNGWVCWKDKKGKLIYQYRKEISKNNKKDSLDIFENKIKNIEIKDDEQKWIEVFPIIGKKLVKIYNGKFDYNLISQVIKVHKGTAFEGIIKGSLTNDDYLNYYLKKYKDKGFLEGYFDKTKREYKVWIIKDLELKPSTLSTFTRAGVANGWVSWKDKKEKLINKYKKNNLKTNKKDFINKFKSNLKNTNFENKLKNISVNKKKNLNINYQTESFVLNNFGNKQDWFEVFPIFNKKNKVIINENAKFQFSISKKLIKISKDTIFRGIIKKNNNYDNLSNFFKKYKNKGNAKGSIDFLTGRYEIEVIKDLITSPSTAAFFTKAGASSNGWLCWKNKEGVLIKNIKNINENQ